MEAIIEPSGFQTTTARQQPGKRPLGASIGPRSFWARLADRGSPTSEAKVKGFLSLRVIRHAGTLDPGRHEEGCVYGGHADTGRRTARHGGAFDRAGAGRVAIVDRGTARTDRRWRTGRVSKLAGKSGSRASAPRSNDRGRLRGAGAPLRHARIPRPRPDGRRWDSGIRANRLSRPLGADAEAGLTTRPGQRQPRVRHPRSAARPPTPAAP